MKKKRFVGLLALASCVTLLTGCESNAFFGLGGSVNDILSSLGIDTKEKGEELPPENPDTPEDPSEPVEPDVPVIPEGSMTISGLPATLFPGDVLDLENYVTLFLIDDFTVELSAGSESVASVEGHKIIVSGEGDLEFTVSAGEFSETFQYDTMHQIRKDFVSLFEGIGNRYTLDIYEPQYDDEDQYTGIGYADTIFHSSNYILSFSSFGSDEQGNLIPGGLLRFSEESDSCYMFELLDGEEGEYVKLMDEYSPRLLEYYNNDFSVDFSTAAYEYDAKNDIEMFVVEGNDAQLFAENSLFIPNGALSLSDGSSIPFSRIEFYLQDISNEGEEPLVVPCCDTYVLYQGKNEYWSTGVFWLDEESIGYPLLEAYCVPENQPIPYDYYNEFFQGTKLSDLLVSNESVFGATGYYEAYYGWFDDDGQAIEQPSTATNFFGGILPQGSTSRLMSETSFWDVKEAEEQMYPVSGKTLVQTGTDEDPQEVVFSVFAVEEGYYTEADYDCASVWDDSKSTFAELRNPENWELGGITGVSETTFNEQAAYSFTFRSGKYHGLLYSICDGIEGLGLIEETIEWYYSASGGDNLEEFFDMEMLICPAYGYVQFTINFTWEVGQNYMISLASVYSPSVAQYTSAFEEAINPLCKL